jgi:hypothetical protein
MKTWRRLDEMESTINPASRSSFSLPGRPPLEKRSVNDKTICALNELVTVTYLLT